MVRRRGWVPSGSRAPVPPATWADFTAVFGMGTGVALPLWPPRGSDRGVEPRMCQLEAVCLYACNPVTA